MYPDAFARKSLVDLVTAAYYNAVAAGELPDGEITVVPEVPRDTSHGDYATGFALAAARALRRSPRDIAAAVAGRIVTDDSIFDSCEIAGAGFLNFKLKNDWYKMVLEQVESPDYGRSDIGSGKRVQIEFVSANPTGPMTIGNARGGVLGDSLASVMQFCGYDVTREFYLNDAGNQVELFARSIDARYRELVLGKNEVTFPEDGYHGEDIRDLARLYREQNGDALASADERTRLDALSAFGLTKNIERMKLDLERYGIVYNVWFAESGLHASGYVKETIDKLISGGHTYESDGAVWFKGTAFGMEKDEVLVRSNGFYTYFAVDIAYHRDKLEKRGFDKVIDALGADHHGHTLRFRAGLLALGLDPDKLDFLLFQFVRLYKDGELAKVSKRSGRAISLSDLLDEVPLDAVRFLFNNSTVGATIEFDMDLAIKNTSENPVFYVQYAHARICSLLKTLEAEGDVPPAASKVAPELIDAPEERALVKLLAAFPDVVAGVCESYETSAINRYLCDLAGGFHKFYTECRIRGEAEPLKANRLVMARSARDVLRIGLKLLGVTAPERM